MRRIQKHNPLQKKNFVFQLIYKKNALYLLSLLYVWIVLLRARQSAAGIHRLKLHGVYLIKFFLKV